MYVSLYAVDCVVRPIMMWCYPWFDGLWLTDLSLFSPWVMPLHTQEYWTHFGHAFYSTYAPQTNTVFVIVALLTAFSIFTYVVQDYKYKHLCSFLITAASKGWGLHEGGSKEVRLCISSHLSMDCTNNIWRHRSSLDMQTLEIRRRALELREEWKKSAGNGE